MRAISKILHNKYTKTIIPIVFVVALVFGFFFGLGLVLNADTPVMVVESSSMCIPNNTMPGPPYTPYTLDYFLWTLTHPFDRTLNVGDIIIIQGVSPSTLNINYPNSDIIVYQKPTDPTDTPVVHRVVSSYEEDGVLYFHTKGDGNGEKWPAVPSASEYDSNAVYIGNGRGVPENLVVGKVIMRIPYFGWVTLIMRETQWALPVIVALILLLIVLGFIVPEIRRKKTKTPSAEQKC